MDEVRIGVIGANRGMFVADVLRFLQGARVRSLYDIAPGVAQTKAQSVEGCRAFGGDQWEAFLDSGIDAVVVASPVPFHVAHSIEVLDRGLHVMSEVPAALSIEEAKALVEAVARSKATYMCAENCNYLDGIELLRRMVEAGIFGDIYHAEGNYLHDIKCLWKNPDGSLTWRGQGRMGAYCTHALGPILSVMKDRISQVSCLAHSATMYDQASPLICNYNMLMRTAGGKTVITRVDTISPRPYACECRVQGTKGAFEHAFNVDQEPRMCLTDEEKWRGCDEYKAKFLADRHMPEGAGKVGHAGMEYWMMKAWLEALREGGRMPIDVHAGLDMTLPGVVARESAMKGGQVLPVPDSREWLR